MTVSPSLAACRESLAYGNLASISRPGWEKYAIALAHAFTCHINNTCVVCQRPKTLYQC